MPNQKNAVLFNRVSSADQRDGFSLEAQKKLGDGYSRENHLKIIKSWDVDESASKELDRKHFFEMVDYIKANGIKEVVFDKIDRACRGMRSAVVIEELVELGVRFHFARDRLIVDKDSPSQEKLRFYLGVILGKYYIDNLKSEINKGREEKLREGHWVGKAPIGYLNFRDPSTKKSIITIDDKTAPAVQEIFELYATGNYGLTELAERLSQNVPERDFTKRTIEGMLDNPFYYGQMRIKGKIIPAVHKPIITKELFDKCKKIRGIRASHMQTNKVASAIKKPFMGLIRCGICHHAITGEVKKVKTRIYTYYHCANSACNGRRRNIPESVLWEQVTAAFEPFQRFTPEATEAFLNSMGNRLEDLDLYTQKQFGILAEKRLEIKKKLNEADRLFKKGILSPEEYDEVRRIRREAMNAVEGEINAYLRTDRKAFDYGRKVIETFHKAYDFMRLDSDPLKKIELVKLVLSKLSWEGGTLRYEYQNPFDVLLDLSMIPVWWRRRDVDPKIVLQFSHEVLKKAPLLLAS